MKARNCFYVLWITLFVCVAFFVVSCSPGPESLIIGKWQVPGSNNTVEYFKDGTVKMVDGDITMRGKFEFLARNWVQIHLVELGVFPRFEISVSKNKLTMDDGGGPVTYQRVERSKSEITREPEITRELETTASVSRQKDVLAKAETADAYSQGVLANMYYWGDGGVEKNYQQALKWARLSAEQEHPLGQYILGILNYYGLGVLPENEGKGQALFAQCVDGMQQLAREGDALAQFNLGLMYAYGWAVTHDKTEAAKWYKKSAQQGNKSAMREYERCQEIAEKEAAPVEAVSRPEPGEDLTLDLGEGVKLELVWIPAGEFMMGSADGESNEKPVHRVEITRGFWMGKYELTQGQYKTIMKKNWSCFKWWDNPVETVSWDNAKAFCEKLTKKLDVALFGLEVSLPTEAEWEYACRAWTTTEYYTGNTQSDLNSVGWYHGNSSLKPHTVGQKEPNAFGLYDMHGNVAEWCEDWYGSGYYAKSPNRDPMGPVAGGQRVNRGGSWGSLAETCGSAHRSHRSLQDLPYGNLGFRVVLRKKDGRGAQEY